METPEAVIEHVSSLGGYNLFGATVGCGVLNGSELHRLMYLNARFPVVEPFVKA